MTTQRLRDLMEERVADVETDDLATRAWARADGVRRRRRIAVTGTAVAAVLAVAGGRCTRATRPTATSRPRAGPDHDDVAARADRRRRGAARRPRRRVPRRARSGGRRPPSATPSSRSSQVPGIPAELSMADGSRTPTATGPRGRRVRPGQAAVPAAVRRALHVGRPGGPARRRSPTRAATSSARSDQGVSRPTGRRCSSGSPVASRSGTCRATPGGRSRPLTSTSTVVDPWTGRSACTRPTGRPDPWDRGDHSGRSRSRVRTATAAELDWMAEGASAPSASEPGSGRQPRVPGRRHPGGAGPARVRDGQEQDVLRADGVVQPRLPVVLRLRPATGRTGCWPGGSARRTCTASATTPTSRPGTSRRAGPRTRSASRGAR